jgi:hypothetical protein
MRPPPRRPGVRCWRAALPGGLPGISAIRRRRGWLSRAARIIERGPELRENSCATAYVTGDRSKRALARQAAEIAGEPSDLELMAMHAVGQALVQQGRTEKAALLDEAMAGVIGGEYGDP